MPALPSSLISSLSPASATVGEQVPQSGLLAVLEQLPDPRAERGLRHRLATVVAAAACAVVVGYRSSTAIPCLPNTARHRGR
ncbi:transposase family protein [Rhizomonospora bruguierae]|uniref:transposase family protein n=1 Tax=Rhizomonospora bruguierae TaxID=1581705 RepID=UPI001BD0EE26|nr:transposase family protein [Micromonospora sp. NBRC 107566]